MYSITLNLNCEKKKEQIIVIINLKPIDDDGYIFSRWYAITHQFNVSITDERKIKELIEKYDDFKFACRLEKIDNASGCSFQKKLLEICLLKILFNIDAEDSIVPKDKVNRQITVLKNALGIPHYEPRTFIRDT
jgi:hypothetical protein